MSQQNPETTPSASAAAAPAPPAPAGAASAPSAASSKKGKRNVPRAIVHVQASFNNTIITIADPSGETLCWDSAGTIGFKGSRKSTPFAAQKAAEKAAE